MEPLVSPATKIVKMENNTNLDKNISNSFTKLPGIRLSEQFVIQSSRVAIPTTLNWSLSRDIGESCNHLFTGVKKDLFENEDTYFYRLDKRSI